MARSAGDETEGQPVAFVEATRVDYLVGYLAGSRDGCEVGVWINPSRSAS